MANQDIKSMKGSENPFLLDTKPKKSKKWVGILILLLIIGGAAAVVALNLFGVKDMLLDMLIKNEPAYADAQMNLENKEAELDYRQQTLQQLQTELEAKEANLDKREEQLDEREAQLEAEGGEGVSGTGGGAVLTEQEEENYTQIAKIYENMDAANAARIFENMMDNEEVARIMKYMKAKNSGAVLEQFTAQMAAEISKLMTQ